jgi:hypothetical protein
MGFELSNYSIARLKEYLASYSQGATNIILERKFHLGYFASYFRKFDAKVIFVEQDYIDKDYLEDYSFYYVSSFFPYRRFCSRFHFFTIDFSNEDFMNFIGGKPSPINEAVLYANYLGFIVIKPLPQTIIGRTCLKTYPPEGKRFYPIIRAYPVNLFGIKLSVDSIAFQEQDSIVAACASSAIWTAFHATGSLFHHAIPSPVAISKAATKFFPFLNRHFPNSGLTAEQMAHAIRNVGLEPFIFNANYNDLIKAVTYAFLKAKIPLVLGVNLKNQIENHNLGYHAVTLTGYSFDGPIGDFQGDKFILSSSRINKIYVHDDQVGPFARMEFIHAAELSTSWKDNHFGRQDDVIAEPMILVLPLYNKIRIPFLTILMTFKLFDKIIRNVTRASGVPSPEIEWDIFLSTINDFKHEIIDTPHIESRTRQEILINNFPRFIWRVIGTIGSEKIEFIFDATDIEQGNLLRLVLIYSKYLFETLKNISSYIDITKINSHLVRNLIIKLQNTTYP